MSKEFIIQYIEQEIRIALREDGVLVKLFSERPDFRNLVGGIYKGKVLKVIPGMESAFIDLGLPKAAFLNVSDIEKNPIAHDDLLDETSSKPDAHKKISISDVLTEGQDIIVQIYKGPINNKGVRVSTSISIPGRNLVFLPGQNGVSISKQIFDNRIKSALKKMLHNLKSENYGLIVRTHGQGTSESDFGKEIAYLSDIWNRTYEKSKKLNAPALLFEEPNIIYRLFRDNLGQDINQIVIDDKDEYLRLKSFLESYMPYYTNKLLLFDDDQDIFDAYNINDELNLALERKVPLDSGGHLIIDQSEALTAIDVNTGRFVGDDSHAETVLQTNLESVSEIVHQLRLRDIGGIIVIDFIDMQKTAHRQQVYKALKNEIRKDKARPQISAISEMGLIEMTRKRTQDSLNKLITQPCYCCRGTGVVASCESTFFNICRQIYHLKRKKTLPTDIVVHVHPDVFDYVEFENPEGLYTLRRKMNIKIRFEAIKDFYVEQYKIVQSISQKIHGEYEDRNRKQNYHRQKRAPVVEKKLATQATQA